MQINSGELHRLIEILMQNVSAKYEDFFSDVILLDALGQRQLQIDSRRYHPLPNDSSKSSIS